MFSDKYLFAHHAKTVNAQNFNNQYAVNHLCPNCEQCSSKSGDDVIEETGSYAKYIVIRCQSCKTVYSYVD